MEVWTACETCGGLLRFWQCPDGVLVWFERCACERPVFRMVVQHARRLGVISGVSW